MRTTGSTSDTEPLESRYQEDNLTYYEVDEVRCFANDEYLHQKIREHQSEVLIGACDYPAARAAAVAGDLPLWADIHGYPMGEAQARHIITRNRGTFIISGIFTAKCCAVRTGFPSLRNVSA